MSDARSCMTCLDLDKPLNASPCSDCLPFDRKPLWIERAKYDPASNQKPIGVSPKGPLDTPHQEAPIRFDMPVPHGVLGHNGGPPLTDWDNPVTNPKEAAGSKKPAIWSVMPRWINLLVGRVMSVGAAKYGAFNYRDSAITASTYEDALERHAVLWFDGEDNDPETGVSHLASMIAGCALLLDAQATGRLVDNRQKTGQARIALDMLQGLLQSLPLPARHSPA